MSRAVAAATMPSLPHMAQHSARLAPVYAQSTRLHTKRRTHAARTRTHLALAVLLLPGLALHLVGLVLGTLAVQSVSGGLEGMSEGVVHLELREAVRRDREVVDLAVAVQRRARVLEVLPRLLLREPHRVLLVHLLQRRGALLLLLLPLRDTLLAHLGHPLLVRLLLLGALLLQLAPLPVALPSLWRDGIE